jgi:hypothetical protein
MMKSLKQFRSAIGMINPEAVYLRSIRRLAVCLVAADATGYAEMEDFLLPAEMHPARRAAALQRVYHADDPDTPEFFDLVLYQQGIPVPPGGLVINRAAPEETLALVASLDDDLTLPLARTFPVFRRAVVDGIIHAVARENALFALATAVPNVVPSLIELPWALGEFASDTAFLTMNQVRMAFLIAAACGREVGFVEQKAAILSITAGAFGWRAIARELVGKIPLGGGLIPKGAIAYAGTYVVGKGLEHFNRARSMPTRAQREIYYQQGYARGKVVTATLRKELPPPGPSAGTRKALAEAPGRSY